MIRSTESLLKYKNPKVLEQRMPKKGQTQKQSHKQPSVTVLPSYKTKSPSASALTEETEKILNEILPPQEWTENDEHYLQHVSSAPGTVRDVINLQEELDFRLLHGRAKETGICPIRSELYRQCFDEIIRHVTINCAERGMLLARVKNEIYKTVAAYREQYQSSMAFGIRKALQAEQYKLDSEQKIAKIENEIRELERQLDEQKADYEAKEREENEQLRLEQEKCEEEISSYERNIQQIMQKLSAMAAKRHEDAILHIKKQSL